MSIGSFCLVLHAHMPYVLHHGQWPHGEDWLYEAAAETYLPLLALISECQSLNAEPFITLGLTPILLEQLGHDHFKQGFPGYLQERHTQARLDRLEFEREGQLHQAYLAERWERFFEDRIQQFQAIHSNIPGAFAELSQAGILQILTSGATHGYLPLLLEDASVWAQLRAGRACSHRHLGFQTRGLWLPEGAYRPEGQWTPPVQWGHPSHRRGLDHFVCQESLNHFFIESHLLPSSFTAERQYPTQEVIRVPAPGCGGDGVAGLINDAPTCQQVWSGFVGYPANGAYLEFHKRHGERRGLRYWKVTDCRADLGAKDLYYPDDVPGKIYEHTHHFCEQVRRRLWDYHHQTGRHGVVVACFDAELFGHWWFEGPRFLRDVLLTLHADPHIELCTAEDYLQKHPPLQTVPLQEGSWGEGGDHRVWTDPFVQWMWQTEYRCESLFGKLTYHLPWRQSAPLRALLEKAGRELLLLQASDWPFMVSRRQAVDYGIKRFSQHVSRFELFTDLAEQQAANPNTLNTLTPVQRSELRDAELHDVVFPHVDLNWWNVTGATYEHGPLTGQTEQAPILDLAS